MTFSEENYIKAIFHLGVDGIKAVSTNAVAEQMSTKPSSVTDMMKKLAEKGLVNYKKYRGVSLTERGRKMALSIVRKHRLWEVFLVEKLDFNWDEVHEIAEQLEHVSSEKLIDKLDALLGFPDYDPHGDPIPGKNGQIKKREKELLSQMEVNSSSICVGVKDSSVAFLRFLDKNKISLGNNIRVLEIEEFDNSLHVLIEDRPLHLSQMIASNLYVKKV